jgi:hypothetical protein
MHNHRAIYGQTEKKVRTIAGDADFEVRQVTDSTAQSIEKLTEQLNQVVKLLSSNLQRSSSPARSRPRSPSPRDLCYKCGKPGHFKQSCPAGEPQSESKPKVQFDLTPRQTPSPKRAQSPAPLNEKGSSLAANRS